ncbi:S24 family peptidase [Paraflavisolibacter sp. H34]|uniref:S24 family peptidase n=1 Tax=Huijunlia imazamoxiresistens TaxID=3127457 RepID=UPI0030187DC5
MISAHNLKEIRQLYNLTQEEFAQSLGITRELINKMEKGKCPVSRQTSLLLQKFLEERRQREEFSHEATLIGQAAADPAASVPYHLQRREQKNEAAPPMAPLVGIKAQAGYIKGFEQVDFLDSLEKFSLPPGVKAGGAQWSYFEVEGDSMEPTFSDGDILLASMVHAEDWQEIKNFYVYVILTADRLMVKRVYRKSPEEWVLISDNDEVYPQKLLPVHQVREVWVFRRHIKAKAPVPKMFEIQV